MKNNEWSWNFISFLVCFHHCRKERKDCQIHFHPSTTNFHSFSLIQYHQTNHSNHNQTTMRMRRGKGENEHHQQPSNKSKTPSFNARVKRGWKQTTLPQLPAFPALCKCNEHPITSNAHSYPSHHFNADRNLSHWCFRRLKSIQQSNEWVWRAWQEKYPTRWEMTIHYTANDYSLFNTKQ